MISNRFPMNVTTHLGEVNKPDHHLRRRAADKCRVLAARPGVFTASILIPLVKLMGPTWLLWCVHHHSERGLRRNTGLYRFIEEIERWSNIGPGTGAPASLAVIVPRIEEAHGNHGQIEDHATAVLAWKTVMVNTSKSAAWNAPGPGAVTYQIVFQAQRGGGQMSPRRSYNL